METNNRVIRCTAGNQAVVKKIMLDPSVYPYIADDGSPPAEDFPIDDLLGNDAFYFLHPNAGSIFLFSPFSYRVFMVHTCVLPGFRGKTAVDAGKAVTRWMFDHANAVKIISVVPEDNPKAMAFGIRCGYSEEGFISNAWVKGGRVFGIHVIGKGAPCQQGQ